MAEHAYVSRDAGVDDVEAQLRQIKAEVEQRPPLSARDVLGDDCALALAYAHDEAYLRQIHSLYRDGGGYRGIRYSRRDGNCFYRCVSFRLFELAMQHTDVALRCTQLVDEMRPQMRATYGAYSDDFSDTVHDLLSRITAGDVRDAEALREVVNAPEYGYVLVYFRYVVSLYIRAHAANTFLPFIQGMGYDTAEAYCVTEVEPVDHESDNIQVVAFAMLCNLVVHVVALDRNAHDGGGDSGGVAHDRPTTHVFNKDTAEEDGGTPDTGSQVRHDVYLLYTPGHYDLLET